MSVHQQFMVVGVDESAAALDAARWAGAEAARRHCPLRVVHAFNLPAMAGYPEFSGGTEELQDAMRRAGQELVERTATDLRERDPDLVVTTRVVYERTAVALRAESAGAELTVVGSGGESRVGGAFLGSVTLAMASTALSPVAVVHLGDRARTTGPVVVGVDGTATSEAAIAFAVQSAAIRGTEVVAVHAWHDVVVAGSHRWQNPLLDPERLREQEQELLAERVAGWAEKYPDVPIRRVLAHERAVPCLLAQAEQAQLLVVGSHGRGGFSGMLLGSTSHALIVHSAAPVVVVRPDAAG